jgi:hypothetical protein
MNIVEILKKCPIGTKLYSPICGECRLEKIYGNDGFDVITNSATFGFSYDGRYTKEGEVCIFPSKEERDWNKFQMPYVYKNGDIVYLKTKNGRKYIIIFKNIKDDYIYTHIDLSVGTTIWFSGSSFNIEDIKEHRFATEKEKQKLFKELKVNGYKWNDETKTLDKLVKSKFDISTLKPFESRVLVRHTEDEIWKPAIFGCYNGYRYYILGNVHWVYCIPYEGNEHLCGKKNDCDEYYKTWE